MNLSYKLQKLVTGEALASIRRRAANAYPRLPLALEARRIAKTVRAVEFEQVRQKYAVPDPGDTWPKYLDLKRWLAINLHRARRLGLDFGPRKSILDLGCGVGYFLYVCQYCGHDVLGLDLEDTPGFAEMVALLTVPRVLWRIAPFVPLPDLGKKFDVITAHMICFNGHKTWNLWRIAEWEFFLNDLTRHLQPNGVVCLELNREPDGTNYTPGLKAYFESRGAEVHSQRVLFQSLARPPARGAQAIAGVRKPFGHPVLRFARR